MRDIFFQNYNSFIINVRILIVTAQRRVLQQVANSARESLLEHHLAGTARPLLQSTLELRAGNVSRIVFVGGAAAGKESALDPPCGPVQGPDEPKVPRSGGEPTERAARSTVSRAVVATRVERKGQSTDGDIGEFAVAARTSTIPRVVQQQDSQSKYRV